MGPYCFKRKKVWLLSASTNQENGCNLFPKMVFCLGWENSKHNLNFLIDQCILVFK